MPSFRSAKSQAAREVKALKAFHTPRHGTPSDGVIHSRGTARTYTSQLTLAAAWFKANGFMVGLDRVSPELAEAYLHERAEVVTQSTLDADRQALQAVLQEKLPAVRSQLGQGTLSTVSRHYTDAQVSLIAESQRGRNRLATEVARAGGLRAHELLTLRRVEERGPSTHREWSGNRFLGREDHVRYTVADKGGLVREVALPVDLSKRLEAGRLATPERVTDRGVYFERHYAIGGGQAWSQSFSNSSKSQLGWSTGAHSLRHLYAQARMSELQRAGRYYDEALEIVSQEMGHFRPDITEVYLR